ncbi:MAG: FCD domain-containing protein [Candidatus Dormibacteria bacterium]|jgi:DNA-binding FadR family transcriptional regulator
MSDHRRSPLAQQVAARIQGWVASGRYGTDSRFPPERELAIQLGVSRTVVREAFRILETRDLVHVRHGVGTFATQKPALEGHHLELEVGNQLAAMSVTEILEARKAIESVIAATAALRRDVRDIDALKQNLADSAQQLSLLAVDGEEWSRLDVEFHKILGACTHNALLEAIQVQLADATIGVRRIASDSVESMKAALRFHDQVADAVIARDAAAAAAILIVHLLDVQTRLIAAMEARAPFVDTES